MSVILHLFDDILALFPKRHSEVKENASFFEGIWEIHEQYNYIIIDNHNISFFEFIYSKASINGFRFVIDNYPNFILSLYIQKVPQQQHYDALKKKADYLLEQKASLQQKGIMDTNFIDGEIQKVKEDMQRTSNDLSSYLYLCVLKLPYMKDIQKLKILNFSSQIKVFPLFFKQLEGLRLLFLKPAVDAKKYTSYTKSLNIFQAFDPIQPKGIFLGHDTVSGVPIFEDFFQNENYNSVIIAKSGAGKSFLAKKLIERMIFSGIHVLSLDSENEYAGLCSSLGGINIQENQLFSIDRYMQALEDVNYIFDLLPHIFTSEVDLGAMQYYFSGIESYGNFYRRLEGLDMQYKQKIISVINLGEEPIDVLQKNHFTNFVVQSENVKIPLYKIIKYGLLPKEQKTILVIDEAHKVMDDELIAKLIRQAAKRGRKYNLGILIISQDIIDFVQNKWSKAVLSNATIKFLLKQEAISMPLVNEVFGLDGYDAYLRNAKVGEGLFIKNDTIRKMSFDPA